MDANLQQPQPAHNGLPTRLVDVFRGPQFTLLQLFPPHEAVHRANNFAHINYVEIVGVRLQKARSNVQAVFIDAEGHVLEAYGGGLGEYVLIRPDGYIGWIGTEKTLAELETYVSRVAAVSHFMGRPTQ
jgi:hypothetical protein